MPKRILSVGYAFPGGEGEYVRFDSTQSLLDADVVIFEPGLALEQYSVESTYEGKPSLHDRPSFQTKERVQHWRRELQAATNAGKLVVVWMVAPEVVFVKTGKQDVSGTGRNARVTNYVTSLSSYEALPFDLGTVVAATGAGIVPAGDLKYLATLWKEFGPRFKYEAYFDGKVTDALLKTRSGNRVIGAGLRSGKGSVLLIPPIDFGDTPLVEGSKNDQRWTTAAREAGKRLLQCLVEIANTVASDAQITPAPGWVADARYRLSIETEIEQTLQTQSAEIERLRAEHEALRGRLIEVGGLRGLLFEKGPQLESAILEALRLMGFQAEPFDDGESEFDAVFTSAEGRFLGEAEGRDSHAINIDKLSQLERNIQEDFAREEVTSPAKGVLFGNAYRLQKPEERSEFFTRKCVKGAKRSRIALVRTPELFAAAHYLKGCQDLEYAAACRRGLLEAEGSEVSFPPVPAGETEEAAGDVTEVVRAG